MKTHVSTAIYSERRKAKLTQDELAQLLGISRAGLNRLENKSRRPDAETLPRLCHNWPDPTAGIRIAIEQLRDEWDRCGLPAGAVTIRASDDSTTEDAAATLRAIRAIDAQLYAHLVALMRSIVTATSSADTTTDAPRALPIAAETRATYTTKRRKS